MTVQRLVTERGMQRRGRGDQHHAQRQPSRGGSGRAERPEPVADDQQRQGRPFRIAEGRSKGRICVNTQAVHADSAKAGWHGVEFGK